MANYCPNFDFIVHSRLLFSFQSKRKGFEAKHYA